MQPLQIFSKRCWNNVASLLVNELNFRTVYWRTVRGLCRWFVAPLCQLVTTHAACHCSFLQLHFCTRINVFSSLVWVQFSAAWHFNFHFNGRPRMSFLSGLFLSANLCYLCEIPACWSGNRGDLTVGSQMITPNIQEAPELTLPLS